MALQRMTRESAGLGACTALTLISHPVFLILRFLFSKPGVSIPALSFSWCPEEPEHFVDCCGEDEENTGLIL